MARDFSKNTANFMSLGLGAIVPALAGSSQVSIHAFVTVDTFTANQTACNDFFVAYFNDGDGAINLYFRTSGGTNLFAFSGRSSTTDGLQTAIGTTALSTGTQYSLGVVIDYANDRIRLFVNGAQEVNAAVTFGQTVLTQSGGTTGFVDMIGCLSNATGTAAFNTTRQMDGRISELSVFTSDIGLAGMEMLSDGFAADMIGPVPAIYFPLLGDDSPERDHYGGKSGTINGTIAQADHPRIIYPVAPRFIFPVTVTPTFRAPWTTRSRSIIGGGVR